MFALFLFDDSEKGVERLQKQADKKSDFQVRFAVFRLFTLRRHPFTLKWTLNVYLGCFISCSVKSSVLLQGKGSSESEYTLQKSLV